MDAQRSAAALTTQPEEPDGEPRLDAEIFRFVDHSGRIDTLDDMHRRKVADIERHMAETKRALHRLLAADDAEIAAIENRKAAAIAAALEADDRLAAKCRAFLSE